MERVCVFNVFLRIDTRVFFALSQQRHPRHHTHFDKVSNPDYTQTYALSLIQNSNSWNFERRIWMKKYQ